MEGPVARRRASPPVVPPAAGFAHEALLYAGDEGFVNAVAPAVAEAVERREEVMVAVAAPKIDRLRAALGPAGGAVTFVDMGDVGANPACILPAWHDFLAAAGDRAVFGVGEPIGPERSRAALLECQYHEVLLNTAFGGGPSWWLLCPYDTAALGEDVLDEAARSHPFLLEAGEHRPSGRFADGVPAGFDDPLPDPPGTYRELTFDFGPLGAVRSFVASEASHHGLGARRVTDLLLAVNEAATNSICHGGGKGAVRVWRDGDGLVCEVRDRGTIAEPLAGRRRPGRNGEGGRGLWLIHHLCDLVEVRSSGRGTVVRMHLDLG